MCYLFQVLFNKSFFKTFSNIPFVEKKVLSSRDGNETGSGRIASIPIPSHLFETIFILVLFKKLNMVERVGMINSHTRPV